MYILGYLHYLSHQLGWKQKIPTAHRSGAQAADHAAGHGIGQAVRRALSALRTWRQRQAAIRQLDSLPDVTLRDIGLDRAEIPATVAALISAKISGRDLARPGATAQAKPLKTVCCG